MNEYDVAEEFQDRDVHWPAAWSIAAGLTLFRLNRHRFSRRTQRQVNAGAWVLFVFCIAFVAGFLVLIEVMGNG